MKTPRRDLFFLFLLWLLLLLLTTAQVVYVYAVFGRDSIQDVVLVKKVERREIDLRNQLMEMFIRSNTSRIS
jgi:hypothetical protein